MGRASVVPAAALAEVLQAYQDAVTVLECRPIRLAKERSGYRVKTGTLKTGWAQVRILALYPGVSMPLAHHMTRSYWQHCIRGEFPLLYKYTNLFTGFPPP